MIESNFMTSSDLTQKRIRAWALYDWGNSAYSTTVMAGFFPVFFKEYWSAGADATLTTARLGDLLSLTSLIVALMTPFLGALADARQAKKLNLAIFMLMGILGCFGLGFIGQGAWIAAALCYAIATIGFNSSTTFYDSLLPSVAPGSLADKASSLGYALGYLGGGVLFLINVLMFLFPGSFGLADGVSAIKLSFISVAFWWLIFSIPLFRHVPEPPTECEKLALGPALRISLMQIRDTLQEIWRQRDLRFLLLAFWLYIDGVYTVMSMAVDFGLSIGFQPKDLIAALLLVQFIGFPSALFFGRYASRFGSKRLIQICIGAYAAATVLAAFMDQAWHFYALAVFIGLVQGGVQALSRSLFSRMIPPLKAGEYFGVMNLIGRFAAIFGPFLVARMTWISGNHRIGLMSLLILFAGGSWLLAKVREPVTE